jgi:tetratricopeptide (TPR) repeat protein
MRTADRMFDRIRTGTGTPWFLRTAVLIPFVLSTACNTTNEVRDENTLTRLDQVDVAVQDEQIDDSLHKAMESYRKYIKQAPASTVKPEAIHRLADLEVEKSYRIEGVEAPAEPGAEAAIKHYTRLLAAYPQYDHNDRVLYQLSRAYEEAGDNRNAVKTLERLIARYPDFERMDEVKFRLGEHYFRDGRYVRANQVYDAVIASGEDSVFYESALKKQGWSYFKQDKYSHALHYFITALDFVIEQGYVPSSEGSQVDNRQTDDIYRAISLTFTYMGGADAIEAYLAKTGNMDYEQAFYRHLAAYYLSRERYTDATKTYQAYIDKHPLNAASAGYSMRIIEVYQQGKFNDLAIGARADFASGFGPESAYFKQLDKEDQALTQELQKANIRSLASYYHARFQKLKPGKARSDSYRQAKHWYREYYYQFPLDDHAPQMSKLLAELYLENGDYREAAVEFERIAKNDPASELAAESAYAALFAHREHLKKLPESRQRSAREHIADQSLIFAENYPDHAETSAVLTAAAYDFLVLKHFSAATATARQVINDYPDTDPAQIESSWIVLADAEFEAGLYANAEQSYSRILATYSFDREKKAALTENLAASIYRQAEYSKRRNDHATAAQHFLRLKQVAPGASLSASAQYEAASSLVSIGDWTRAAVVLEDFQRQNPTHELADATTRNLAAIYQRSDDLLKSAAKLEVVAAKDKDIKVRREALLEAGDLYTRAERPDDALRVYRQYTQRFPYPAEDLVETYNLIAGIYKAKGDTRNYHDSLRKVISADAKAGKERSDRTRYLAAQSLLVLAEDDIDRFKAVELTKPFKQKLELKKKRMSTALESLTRLLEYQVSDTTTAATFYIAEIYLHFSQALTNSERPDGLNDLELEEYELALEEQAYLFEDKAISVYQKNTELLDAGIHDPWVDRSIERLSSLFPAQYAKQEQKSGFLESLYARDDRS